MTRARLVARVLALALICRLLWLFRRHRRWLGAFWTILRMASSSLARRLVFSDRLRAKRTELIDCPDGEQAVVWWPSGLHQTRRLWVVLPGGMSHGDQFYLHDAVETGLFGTDDWCVFHNPGTARPVRLPERGW